HTRFSRDWSSDVCSSDLGVVGAAPGHELLLAELGERLGLVLALERAVVALVEPPVALDGDPRPGGLAEGELGGVDGAAQQGGVRSEERRVGKECRRWGAR